MNFEFMILDFIQDHLKNSFMDSFMKAVTIFGNGGIIWIVTALILLIIPKTRKSGAAVTIALIMEAVVCNLILKPVFARVRPFNVNTAVHLIISAPKDFSFPSGHTGASFASASALFFSELKTGKKGWIFALAAALIIAFSRLYLYVHYPTDVLAGMVIGILAGWAGNLLAKRICRSRHFFEHDDIKKSES